MQKEGTIMRQPPTNRIAHAEKACKAEVAPIAEQPEMEAAAR